MLNRSPVTRFLLVSSLAALALAGCKGSKHSSNSGPSTPVLTMSTFPTPTYSDNASLANAHDGNSGTLTYKVTINDIGNGPVSGLRIIPANQQFTALPLSQTSLAPGQSLNAFVTIDPTLTPDQTIQSAITVSGYDSQGNPVILTSDNSALTRTAEHLTSSQPQRISPTEEKITLSNTGEATDQFKCDQQNNQNFKISNCSDTESLHDGQTTDIIIDSVGSNFDDAPNTQLTIEDDVNESNMVHYVLESDTNLCLAMNNNNGQSGEIKCAVLQGSNQSNGWQTITNSGPNIQHISDLKFDSTGNLYTSNQDTNNHGLAEIFSLNANDSESRDIANYSDSADGATRATRFNNFSIFENQDGSRSLYYGLTGDSNNFALSVNYNNDPSNPEFSKTTHAPRYSSSADYTLSQPILIKNSTDENYSLFIAANDLPTNDPQHHPSAAQVYAYTIDPPAPGIQTNGSYNSGYTSNAIAVSSALASDDTMYTLDNYEDNTYGGEVIIYKDQTYKTVSIDPHPGHDDKGNFFSTHALTTIDQGSQALMVDKFGEVYLINNTGKLTYVPIMNRNSGTVSDGSTPVSIVHLGTQDLLSFSDPQGMVHFYYLENDKNITSFAPLELTNPNLQLHDSNAVVSAMAAEAVLSVTEIK